MQLSVGFPLVSMLRTSTGFYTVHVHTCKKNIFGAVVNIAQQVVMFTRKGIVNIAQQVVMFTRKGIVNIAQQVVMFTRKGIVNITTCSSDVPQISLLSFYSDACTSRG